MTDVSKCRKCKHRTATDFDGLCNLCRRDLRAVEDSRRREQRKRERRSW